VLVSWFYLAVLFEKGSVVSVDALVSVLAFVQMGVGWCCAGVTATQSEGTGFQDMLQHSIGIACTGGDARTKSPTVDALWVPGSISCSMAVAVVLMPCCCIHSDPPRLELTVPSVSWLCFGCAAVASPCVATLPAYACLWMWGLPDSVHAFSAIAEACAWPTARWHADRSRGILVPFTPMGNTGCTVCSWSARSRCACCNSVVRQASKCAHQVGVHTQQGTCIAVARIISGFCSLCFNKSSMTTYVATSVACCTASVGTLKHLLQEQLPCPAMSIWSLSHFNTTCPGLASRAINQTHSRRALSSSSSSHAPNLIAEIWMAHTTADLNTNLARAAYYSKTSRVNLRVLLQAAFIECRQSLRLPASVWHHTQA